MEIPLTAVCSRSEPVKYFQLIFKLEVETFVLFECLEGTLVKVKHVEHSSSHFFLLAYRTGQRIVKPTLGCCGRVGAGEKVKFN